MLVALASATAIAILLPAGPDDGCPSPRQVSDAVSAHLPGVVLPLGRAPGPSALRLSVTSDGAGTLRVDLSDPQGGALLRRRVAPETAARTKSAECTALAETAALIVDRYWHEVGYEVPPAPPVVPKPPPPPPPPPAEPKPAPAPTEAPAPEPETTSAAPETVERALPARPERPRGPPHSPDWWIAAGLGGQVGDRGPKHGLASLSLAVERPFRKHRLGLRFSVSGLYPDRSAWSYTMGDTKTTGNAAVVQIPVAMDAYLAFPVGLGRLEPGVGVDLDVILVSYHEGSVSKYPDRAALALDALLAWTIPMPHDVFLRAVASGAVGIVTQHVVADPTETPIVQTPRLRAELGLQLGLSFH